MKSLVSLAVASVVLVASGCVSMVDPATNEIVPARVEAKAFAGRYRADTMRFTRVKDPMRVQQGDAATKNMATLLGWFTARSLDAAKVEAFEIEIGDGLVVTLLGEGGKTEQLRFAEGRDYAFDAGVITFTERQEPKQAQEAAVYATVTKKMSWMLDEQKALVCIHGGHSIGTAMAVIPFGARARGLAVFERSANRPDAVTGPL